jgi:hypothetical protein
VRAVESTAASGEHPLEDDFELSVGDLRPALQPPGSFRPDLSASMNEHFVDIAFSEELPDETVTRHPRESATPQSFSLVIVGEGESAPNDLLDRRGWVAVEAGGSGDDLGDPLLPRRHVGSAEASAPSDAGSLERRRPASTARATVGSTMTVVRTGAPRHRATSSAERARPGSEITMIPSGVVAVRTDRRSAR